MEFPPKHAVPVFPLPGFVLFPHAVVPLHVFEPRYRAMVADALRGDRLIAIALLKPGWEHDYHGSPEFFPIGCLARFQEVQWLPDDCYDLKVVGVSRVRFGRVVREYPYRTAMVSLLPQDPIPEDDPLVGLERRALMDAYARVMGAAGAGSPVLSTDLPLESLVNTVCTALALDAAEKLALLELDSVFERSRQVREMMERKLRRPGARPEGGEHN